MNSAGRTTLTTLCAIFITLSLKAQIFHLVKDLDTSASSYPATINDSVADKVRMPFTTLNGIAYFSADDGTHGRELWRSDGTTAGTTMVADIITGVGPGEPQSMKACNNRIFFTGRTFATVGLFVTDGTASGTILLKMGMATKITPVGNVLYFLADNGLWKSDGTVAGTTKVIDIRAVTDGFMGNLMTAHGKLFFQASRFINGVAYYKLWTSDGTAQGTIAIGDNFFDPDQLTEGTGNTIYFSAHDLIDYKRRLYVFNGQPGSAAPAPGNNDVVLYASSLIVKLGETLYFAGSSTGAPSALYSYRTGSDSGTQKVKTLPGTANGTGIQQLEATATQVFMRVGVLDTATGKNNYELWRSDGSESGTFRLGNSSSVNVMALCGNFLYLQGWDKSHGAELWRSDGTSAGTVLVKDIFPGSFSSAAGDQTSFCYLSGKIIFGATGTEGRELWVSSGGAGNTMLLKNINIKSTASAAIQNMTPVKNDLFFIGVQNEAALPGLWKTDGTAAGTIALDSFSVYYSGAPALPVKGDSVYFVGNDITSGVRGLFITNGKRKGTRLVKAFPNLVNLYWIKGGEKYIYIAMRADDGSGTAVWCSDGTPGGTVLLHSGTNDINYLDDFVPSEINGIFYFCYTVNNLSQVWRTDGTVSGTHILSEDFGKYNASPMQLTAFRGKAFFRAQDIFGLTRLWQTDGTDTGTFYFPGIIIETTPVCVAGDRLYFSSRTSENGIELWSTDGTLAGTSIFMDIVPGATSSFARVILSTGGMLYFAAEDQLHGSELWKTDGTQDGTKLVKDIVPGEESSAPAFSNSSDDAYATVVGGQVLFVSVYKQLSITNGTDSGTYRINDPLFADATGMHRLTAAGEHAWLLATNYSIGEELYHGRITPVPVPLYTFTGNGDVTDAANWLDGLVPPENIYHGMEVRISPARNGECVISKPLHFKGGKLTIAKDAKLIVPGSVIIKY